MAKQVVESLRKSFEPSMANSTLTWPGRAIQLREVFRDDQVCSYEIMSLAQFEQLAVSFHADQNPLTKTALDLSFTRSAFVETDMPLFQMAAHERLQSLTGSENVACSVKY